MSDKPIGKPFPRPTPNIASTGRNRVSKYDYAPDYEALDKGSGGCLAIPIVCLALLVSLIVFIV